MKHLKRYLALLVLVLLLGTTTTSAKAYIQRQGVITEVVNVRKEAEANSKKVSKLRTGQKVKVNNEITTDEGEIWYQVFVAEDVMGYVPADKIDVEKIQQTTHSEEQTQVVTVTERIGTVTAQTAVRVREKTSTGSAQIASMGTGETFHVLEDETGTDGYVWYKVEFENQGINVAGYVRSDLVSVEEVVKEEYIQVENEGQTKKPTVGPTEEVELENESAPYSIVSQESVTGKTKWYLVDLENGDTTEIEFLLSGGTATLREKVNVGIYKCLILVAMCVAIHFYTRWREAVRKEENSKPKQISLWKSRFAKGVK